MVLWGAGAMAASMAAMGFLRDEDRDEWSGFDGGAGRGAWTFVPVRDILALCRSTAGLKKNTS
jgi:hypothetical protein